MRRRLPCRHWCGSRAVASDLDPDLNRVMAAQVGRVAYPEHPGRSAHAEAHGSRYVSGYFSASIVVTGALEMRATRLGRSSFSHRESLAGRVEMITSA